MKKIILSVLFVFCIIASTAQNIVKNPSFDRFVKIESGIYENMPSSVESWRSLGTPCYFNPNSVNEFDRCDKYEKYRFDRGDSTYVYLCPFSLHGQVDYLIGELDCYIEAGKKYSLEFDYQLIKDISNYSLGSIFVAFSNSDNLRSFQENSINPWGHFYKAPELSDLIEIKLTEGEGWKKAKVLFEASNCSKYFAICYMPRTNKSTNFVKYIIDECSHHKTGRRDLTTIKKIIEQTNPPVEINYFVAADESIKKSDVIGWTVTYAIDNVSICPVEVTKGVTTECDSKYSIDLDEKIEHNISRQLHWLDIDERSYKLTDIATGKIEESDSTTFDNKRLFDNFSMVRPTCFEDSIWHILSSRVLVKSYDEPYYDADSQYLRLCWLRHDKCLIYRITGGAQGMKLHKKIGNGGYFEHGELVKDTTIVMPSKDVAYIIDFLKDEKLEKLVNSDMVVDGLCGVNNLYFDYNMNGHKNTIVINDAYIEKGQIRGSQYKKIYNLIVYLMKKYGE